MNIFVTSQSPEQSAIVLPDRHIVKMPIETAQMLAYAMNDYGLGTLPKKDGTPYDISSKSRRNHPCTQWTLGHISRVKWLILHGQELCKEYTYRYNKIHGSHLAIETAHIKFSPLINHLTYENLNFVRAMPEYLCNDRSITTFEAYKKYLNTKSWVTNNYLRKPNRKPEWIK